MTSSSSLYGTPPNQDVSSTNSTSLYGEAGTPIPDSSGNLIVRGDLYVLSGNILTTATTGNIFPTNATTINLGNAATAVNIGANTGTTTINNDLVVDGTGTFAGDITATGANFGNITIAVVDDNTISTTTGNLVIDSNTNVIEITDWTFNSTGELLLPGGGILGDTYGDGLVNVSIQPGPGGYAGVNSENQQNYFETDDNGVYIGTNYPGATKLWAFNEDGTTQFPSYKFPYADGAVNTVLTTDGAGNVSWALPGGGGSTFGNVSVGVVTDNTISTTTGALVLDSATNTVDITANTYIQAYLNVPDIVATNIQASAPVTGLNLYNNDASNAIHIYDNFVQIVSGTIPGGDWVFNEDGSTNFPGYAFPYLDGSANQVLATNGSGVLAWTSVPSIDTNYTIQADTATGGANLTLVGSDATTDSVKFANGTGVTITRTDANTITTAIGQDVATTANPTFAGATLGNVTVGVATDNTITTTSGQLILKSAGGEIDTDTTSILSTNSASFFLLNSPTTVNAFQGATTTLSIGPNTGTTNINNSLLVDVNATITGDLAVNGGDITTTATTANLFTTAATTINIGGAGNGTSTGNINIGIAGQTYQTSFNSIITQNGDTTQATTELLNQTSTSPILIQSTTRRSMRGMITINDDVTGAVHSVEFLAVRKVSTAEAFITIYAEVISDSSLATFTVTDSGTTLNLYATKASSNSTDIYVVRNSLGAVI